MSKIQYYARPNPLDFSKWWGGGGCELFDELDPECETEVEHHPKCGYIMEVGPFTAEVAGAWDIRARAIPGYCCLESGESAITWRQAKGDEVVI